MKDWSFFKQSNGVLVLYLIVQKGDDTFLSFLDLSEIVKGKFESKLPKVLSNIGGASVDPELKLSEVQVNRKGYFILKTDPSGKENTVKILVFKIGSGYKFDNL